MSYKKTINVALIGNPNTGKTSLFNELTGLNQKVGNYPGVTVDKKETEVKEKPKIDFRIPSLSQLQEILGNLKKVDRKEKK